MVENGANDGTVARRQMSRNLKKLRLKSGFSSEGAAESIGISPSTMYRIENGKRPVSIPEARALTELYGRPDLVKEFEELARASKIRSWHRAYSDVIPEGFDTYIGLEQAAGSFRYYSVQLVPGIFQTDAYARALIRQGYPEGAEAEIDRRVQLRLERQVLLTRPEPAQWHVVLDAAILNRPIGGETVMAGQLSRLLEIADLPYVTFGIIPVDVGLHAGVNSGPFLLMDFPHDGGGQPTEPTTVYAEGLVGALYTVEEREVDAYRTVFETTQRLTLNPEESKTAIIQAINGMEKK